MQILLNLGHSFLRSVSVDNSEEEDDDDVDDNDKENEDKNQLDGSEKKIEEVLLESTKNIKYNVEEEIQTNRDIQLEFSKEYDKGISKLDGKIQGEFYQKKHDNECNLSKRNNKKIEDLVKTEITQKLNTEMCNELYKNDLIENVIKKNEIKREKNQLFSNNYFIVKEQNQEEDTCIQVNSECQTDLDAKVNQEEIIEKQNSEGKIEIDLDIEMLVNTDLHQDLEKKKQEGLFEVEKQQIELDRDVEIELNIEVQVNTEIEQKLGELDKEMQQNDVKQNYKESSENLKNNQGIIEESLQVADKNVQSELNRNDFKQELNTNLQISSKQNFKKDLQHISCISMQENIDEKTQVDSDSEILLELELEAQKKIHEKVVKTFNSEIQQDVERLICNVLNGKHNINEKIQQSLNEEAQAELMKQIQQEILELKREIENYEKVNDEELERELTEEIDKIFSLSVKRNFFVNLLLLLNKDSEPIYERVEKIRKLYFPTLSKIQQPTDRTQTEFDKNKQQKSSEEILHNFNTEEVSGVNSIVPNKLNEETQEEKKEVKKTVNSKIQLGVDKKMSLMAETKLELYHEKQEFEGKLQNQFDGKLQEKVIEGTQKNIEKEVNLEFLHKTMESEEVQINNDEETQKTIVENIQQNSDEIPYIDQDNQVNQYFDIVVQFNREIQQNVDGIVKRVAKRNIQVDLSQEIVNKCTEKIQLNVDNNMEQSENKKYEGEIEKILKKVFEEMKLKVEDKMEVDFDKEVDVKKQEQQYLDKEIHLQIEFYKQMQQEVEGECWENRTHKVFETDIETFKRELFKKSKELQVLEEETQNESDKNDDEFEELQKESDINIDNHKVQKFEEQIQRGEQQDSIVEFEGQILDYEKELHEESDVDVENIEEDMQTEFQGGINKKCGALYNIDDLKENQFSEEEMVEEQQKESEIENFEDMNEVVEIVDEFEVESFSSVDGFIPTDKDNSSADESTNTDEEYSSTEEKEEFNGEQQQLCTEKQVKFNENILDFEGEIHDINGEIRQELYRGSQSEFEKKNSQEFEDLQLETEIENIQDLDEIPLKLKIQQEQFEEKLHQQFKEFQKEFYTNSKLEYDKEKQFKIEKISDPISSKLYDEEQQTFYELKDEFHKIKQEYKDFVQKKIFEELQQNIDEKQLLDIEEFPEEVNDEPNQRIDEDIHKEFIELQRDCFELEPEFKYNVPLEFEEDTSGQFLEEEPYDLIEKLHSIHRKKLCQFVDSKEWPENVSKKKFL